MRGTAFLDEDVNIGWRSEEFLTSDDPMFFQNNSASLIKAWPFDTDNFAAMYAMFSSMRDMRLNQQKVVDFARSIKYDLAQLRNKPK